MQHEEQSLSIAGCAPAKRENFEICNIYSAWQYFNYVFNEMIYYAYSIFICNLVLSIDVAL